MSDFVDKLRLKESAEEDLYFARRDLQLVEAMHEKRRADPGKRPESEGVASSVEGHEQIPEAGAMTPNPLLRLYRSLLVKCRKVGRK